MNYSRVLAILVLLSLLLAGCGNPEMKVKVNIPGSDLVGKCRLNLVTSDQPRLATNIRHSLQEMLVKCSLAANDPLLAVYGLNSDFTMTSRFRDDGSGKSLLFVTLKMEFIDLETGTTLRKTVLHGHVNTVTEVEALVKDMVSGFFTQFSKSSSFDIPVAKGWTGYDKLGRKQLSQGDVGHAIENFKLAIDERPDDHAAHYNLGVAYESLNRSKQALVCYQRAYQIKPSRLYQNAILRVSK